MKLLVRNGNKQNSVEKVRLESTEKLFETESLLELTMSELFQKGRKVNQFLYNAISSKIVFQIRKGLIVSQNNGIFLNKMKIRIFFGEIL